MQLKVDLSVYNEDYHGGHGGLRISAKLDLTLPDDFVMQPMFVIRLNTIVKDTLEELAKKR